jgi:hypothetical protein
MQHGSSNSFYGGLNQSHNNSFLGGGTNQNSGFGGTSNVAHHGANNGNSFYNHTHHSQNLSSIGVGSGGGANNFHNYNNHNNTQQVFPNI